MKLDEIHENFLTDFKFKDSWGYTPSPCLSTHSFFRRILFNIFTKIPPLNVIRAAGPFAPFLLRTTRKDIVEKYESVMPKKFKKSISEYIYHCNSASTTGEHAFHSLLHNGPWPSKPITARMKNVHEDVPLTFIYGAKSWIDSTYGKEIKENRPNSSYTQIEIIHSAGHKVFSDDEILFNSIVLNACKFLKSNQETPKICY